MTLSSPFAIGMLALVQLGAPVHDGAGGGGSSREVEPRVPPAELASLPSSSAGTLFEDALALRAMSELAGTPFDGRLSLADYLWIERTLGELTLREKAAQLVVSYIEGGRPEAGSARWERARDLVRREKVGGFIVGVGSSYGTASWLNELQGWSAQPLLMTADLEWGPGTRLTGATVLPINMAISAAGPASMAYEAGRITALEARAAGIHMAFAPVADVNINPQNPVINTRAYGSDPGEVADRVVEFIAGARSAGLMTVVKHFPGHGDTETDSHLELPVVRADRFRLEAVELAPFRAAVRAQVDGVMTAHLAVPALDDGRRRPATLSPAILTGLLRDDLGFGGLVITDALHMDGVKVAGKPGEVAVAALEAGADVLLIPPDEKAAIDAVVRAVRDGRLSEERIERSARRILAAKALAGLRDERSTNVASLLGQLGRLDHDDWGREVAERSITLVRGEPGALPIGVRDRTVLVVIYDDNVRRHTGQELVRALDERGARVVTVRLGKRSAADDLAQARWLATQADAALFASFSRAIPWKGALGLPQGVAQLARDLAGGGAPVVSFGDPYLLRQLPEIGTYLLAWSNAEVSQVAAARALVGEIPIMGRLPIDLPGGYGVGDGVLLPSLPGITTLPR